MSGSLPSEGLYEDIEPLLREEDAAAGASAAPEEEDDDAEEPEPEGAAEEGAPERPRVCSSASRRPWRCSCAAAAAPRAPPRQPYI